MKTFDYVLGLADDALVMAQRMSWWISRAPELEEDLALANIGLDQLGQARMLLSLAGQREGAGRDEDDLAYLRDDREFRNVLLVERPMADFGVMIARLLLFAAHRRVLYAALGRSSDAELSAIANKAGKEVAYHLDHASRWTIRLGDGTEVSHERMQAALDSEWPYLEELFADPDAPRETVLGLIEPILAEATLSVPQVAPHVGGGRDGRHTESLGHLLAEMQHLHRSHPGATW